MTSTLTKHALNKLAVISQEVSSKRLSRYQLVWPAVAFDVGNEWLLDDSVEIFVQSVE